MSEPERPMRDTELLAELYRELESDKAVLKALADRGDNPTLPHAVEHHFLAPSEAALRRLIVLGQHLGFAPTDIGREDGGTLYSCNLVSHTSTVLPGVHRESLLMRLLGLAHGVDYDGWGTSVEE